MGGGAARRWKLTVVTGMFIGAAVLTMGSAGAQPVPPPPPAPTQPGTSTTEELADMVLDAIEHDSPAAPTTTPAPQP